MKSKIHLSMLCDYADGDTAAFDLNPNNYVATENMLQNKRPDWMLASSDMVRFPFQGCKSYICELYSVKKEVES
ncbi:MAG: hypothetical protein PHI85_07455 [Victivallaceae bacterium]|nr:hypothetical protein [Victivallaceae bacterium]